MMTMMVGGLGYAEAASATQQLQQLFGIIRCPLEYHQYTQPWFIKYNQVSLRSGVPTISQGLSLYVPLSTIGTLNFESQRTVVIHYMLCLYVSQEYHWYTQL